MKRQSFIKLTGINTLFGLFAPRTLATQILTKTIDKIVFVGIMRGGVRKEDFIRNTNLSKSKYSSIIDIKYADGLLTHSSAIHAIINETYIMNEQTIVLPEVSSIHDFIDLKNKAITDSTHVVFFTMGNTDAAHYNIDDYFNEIKRMDQLTKQIFDSLISSDRALADSLILLPDHGRNNYANELGGTDHYHESARDSFCLILSSASQTITDEFSENIHIKKLANKLVSRNV